MGIAIGLDVATSGAEAVAVGDGLGPDRHSRVWKDHLVVATSVATSKSSIASIPSRFADALDVLDA